jgi:hypothetical protein
MTRLNYYLNNDFARIGKSGALARLNIEISYLELDAEYHAEELEKAEDSVAAGYEGLSSEIEYHAEWLDRLESAISRLRKMAESIRLSYERQLEAEPPVRTGRLTREWVCYMRRSGSKPDQTRSRGARRRSIERRSRR